MIDVEDQLAQHLARKAAQATPRSDLDAVTAQSTLILRLAPIARSRAKWRGRLVAGAAAATAVAAVAVVAVRANSPQNTPLGAPDSTCTVFMRPDAGEAQIAGIGERLEQTSEITNLHLVTKEQAYEQFLRIFNGQEDLTRSVTADVLPASWTFDLVPNTATVQSRIVSVFGGDPTVSQARCTDPITKQSITTVVSTNQQRSVSPDAQQLSDIGREVATSFGWNVTPVFASDQPASPGTPGPTQTKGVMAAFIDGSRTLTLTLVVTDNPVPDRAFTFLYQTPQGSLYQLVNRDSFRSLYIFGQGVIANASSDGKDSQARSTKELTDFVTSVSQRWIDK